jgi:hypothetical protein
MNIASWVKNMTTWSNNKVTKIIDPRLNNIQMEETMQMIILHSRCHIYTIRSITKNTSFGDFIYLSILNKEAHRRILLSGTMIARTTYKSCLQYIKRSSIYQSQQRETLEQLAGNATMLCNLKCNAKINKYKIWEVGLWFIL